MEMRQKSRCDAGSFAVTTPLSRSCLRFIRGFEQKKKNKKKQKEKKINAAHCKEDHSKHLRPISVNSHLDMGGRGEKQKERREKMRRRAGL